MRFRCLGWLAFGFVSSSLPLQRLTQNVARLEEKKVGDETEMKCQMPATTHMNLGRRKDGVLFITRPASKCVQDPFPRAFERPDSFGVDVGP